MLPCAIRTTVVTALLVAAASALGAPAFPNGEAVGPNLVPNPGFEQVDAAGFPAGWSGSKQVFAASREQPRNGAFCLRYENHDPHRYVLCVAPVPFEHGARYEIEAWVRTEGVQGKDTGATICMEWADAGKKYIGGTYPAGIKGDHRQWTRIRGLTPPIPANAASCKIVCYVRKGMTGIAWWDDVSVHRWRPAFLGPMATDCYRDETVGGRVTVRVGVNTADYKLAPETIQAELTVLDESGRTALRQSPTAKTSDYLEFHVDADRLEPGRYVLRCRATAEQTNPRVQGTSEGRLVRLDRPVPRRVTFDRAQRLLVDGKPFFPLGTYWTGIRKDQLERYAQSPFNCLMPYSRPTREQLDLAHSLGLKVIYSIKDYYAGTRWRPKFIRTPEDEKPAVTRTVTQFRDHPALLAWYLNDELPLTYFDRLTAHRRWVEELDPNHPCWVVLYQVKQIAFYLPTFHVIGTDPYPIPNKPVRTALEWTRYTHRGVMGLKPIWMVPQIFNRGSYKTDPEKKAKFRAPTLAEMRSMAWQCIAGGANGLIFYSWFDLWRMDKPAKGPNGRMIRDPFEQRWKDVTAMAAEIRRFFPVLLSDRAVPAPQPLGTEPQGVGWRAWKTNDALWVLVANGDSATHNLDLRLPYAAGSMEVQLGDASHAAIKGNVLHARPAALESLMIRITP